MCIFNKLSPKLEQSANLEYLPPDKGLSIPTEWLTSQDFTVQSSPNVKTWVGTPAHSIAMMDAASRLRDSRHQGPITQMAVLLMQQHNDSLTVPH
jgi:hypothetical protein